MARFLTDNPHSPAGISINMPATLATCRAAKPQSTKRPARYAPAAIVNKERPRSAANTRPRNLSSLCICNNVVENTHTIELPKCASITHKQACQRCPETPNSVYLAAAPKYPEKIATSKGFLQFPADGAVRTGPSSAPSLRAPSSRLI